MTRKKVLYPLLILVTLAVAASGYEMAQERSDRIAYPAPGRLIMVNGHRLHLRCTGNGSPTVVLISGFGETSSIWNWVQTEVSRDARVCSYDPAGRAWSDQEVAAQDGIARAADLEGLLEQAGEKGPLVVVGHSFGGLYARIFAARYPERVAGMVLLDASHPDMFTLAGYPKFYKGYRFLLNFFPTLAHLGVGRFAYAGVHPGLAPRAREEEVVFMSTARLARTQRDEWAEAPLAMQQARALTSLGDRPLMVVTALRGAQDGWVPLQRQLTTLSSNVRQLTLPDAEHMSLLENRDEAVHSGQAIREVVTAVRTSASLSRP